MSLVSAPNFQPSYFTSALNRIFMARQLTQEREKEYQELLAFLDFYVTNVSSPTQMGSVDIFEAVEEIAQKFGRSKALIGMRQAINDCVEQLSDKPGEYVEILDDALRVAGIPTVSEIRHRYASTYMHILRRGTIKSETEYYLINGIVVDLAATVTEKDHARLQAMLDAYERPA